MKPEATIVTGGSNGIGAAIVKARAAAGDTVINLDRDQPPAGSPGRALRLDLADREALQTALAEVTAEHDVTRVVNNAGVALLSPIDAFDADDFDRTMAVNLRAPALIVKHCLAGMKARGFGRIVNIASRAALGKGLRTSYAGSKGALISATRVWALELARHGITVNCVAPGPIGTELFHRVNPAESPVTRQILEGIPVGRLGTPEDIAHSVDHFLSPEAGFITGQTLYVCGGMTIGVAPV